MPKLVVISGQLDRPEYALGDETLLGRAPECDIVVPGPLSSRRHARICLSGGSYHLEDLDSANGTILNGDPTTKAELRDGDWITVGDARLTFVLDDAFAPPREATLLDERMPTVADTVDMDAVAEPEATDDPAAMGKLRQRMTVLKEVAERSCGALRVEDLVEQVLDELLSVYPQADHVHAVLSGFAGGGKDVAMSAARPGLPASRVGMSGTLLQRATQQHKALLAADVTSDDRLSIAQSIVSQELRSMMCSPLIIGGRVLGAIQVDTANPLLPFGLDDLTMLATISGQVAVAVENARLHRDLVAQERLAAVGQAVSGIAHCIKNALNGLQGGSYILDLGIKKEDAERVTKGWGMVKRNAAFMSDMVKDMLAYCRKAPPSREPTDVAALMGETLAMVEEAAAQQGITTALEAADGLPQAVLDPTGIKRVVLNLLTNAVEACEEGGQVTVGVEPDDTGHAVVVTVQDTGPGMPPEVREHLFEPFFTTKGSRGTGLGLALVKKVIDEHHGMVHVESVAGEGTTFRIALPVATGEDETVLSQPD